MGLETDDADVREPRQYCGGYREGRMKYMEERVARREAHARSSCCTIAAKLGAKAENLLVVGISFERDANTDKCTPNHITGFVSGRGPVNSCLN